MYSSPTNLVLGFHGCDRQVGEAILCGRITHLSKSQNEYDWLGHGIYFWENNPSRAKQFAEEQAARPVSGKPRIKAPFVLGAVIDPGNCLNLLEAKSLALLRDAFQHLSDLARMAGHPLPINKLDQASGEFLRRELDCAVIESLHELNEAEGGVGFDSVRGVFQEGAPLYPTAGFSEKTHIQWCVRSNSSIRGYFRPLTED